MVLAIKAENLGIGYYLDDGTPMLVVRDISFELEQGSSLCIVGESGCGKTTLASAISGILPPHSFTRGRLYIFDKIVIDGDFTAFNGVRGELVSYIPQNPGTSLNPYLTIADHFFHVISSKRKIKQAEVRKIAIQYLEKVGLSSSVLDMYPHELSGGMQQRVAIALALATGAKILVADEPTSAVDAHLKRQVVELLNNLVREHGLTLVVVTHEIQITPKLCNKVAVMYAGRFLEYGKTSSVMKNPRHPYTIMLVQTTPVLGYRKPLKPLPGEPPDFMNQETWCPLYPRCPIRDEHLCLQEPQLKNIGGEDEHYVRCWLT